MEEGKEANQQEIIIWGALRWQSLPFKVKMILNYIWSGRERLNMCLIAIIIMRRIRLN